MIRKASYLLAGAFIGASAVIAATQTPLFTGNSANAAAPDTYRALNLFGDVFERVRSEYVEQPDEQKMIESAINGMLTSLDPHSAYMDPAAFSDMQVTTRGEFGGLGIEVTMEDGLVKVVAPMDDTPAARAGILSGDVITAINGESIEGLSLNDAVDQMRGEVNTPITLTIARPDTAAPFDVKLVREIIRVQSVRSRVEGDIGYIRITTFSEQTFEGLQTAIQKIDAQVGPGKVRGYILDLRNNPGGLLEQAIDVADAFLDHGEIVSTRGRHPEDTQRYNARAGDLVHGLPVIVLINGGSASASEIVAGALQDHRRATVLGSRSFGKASVQTIIQLGPQNGALRLTTARYYTPSGRSIQAKGIEPDIAVVQDLPADMQPDAAMVQGEASLRGHLATEGDGAEQSGSSAYVPPDPKDDKQLNYAIDLLRGLQANSAFPPDPNQGIPN